MLSAKKRKKNTQAATPLSPPAEERAFTWGLGNYLPDPPSSEDDASIDIHIQSLQREFRKTSADVNVEMVDQKMTLAFAQRGKLVVTDKLDFKNLIDISLGYSFVVM
ncbi:hypothetical protein MHBO_004003 [Bonamia ostreae]|uniref:Uncharacterized protein n=1 Tax=Bonamia ostreae TaxID=126728 RepID=A0ABV2AS42_9EUKA